jgi:hypothetical protein
VSLLLAQVQLAHLHSGHNKKQIAAYTCGVS